ncbi:MAG: hypothetical protein ACTSYL_00365 [Candidatus Thorarchaeota archaeon]
MRYLQKVNGIGIIVASLSGRVYDLTKAPLRDWVRVFNEGSDYDSLPFTEHDLHALIKKGIVRREHLLVGYDGPVPTSVARVIDDPTRRTLGIGDFVVAHGRRTAGFNLVNSILRCARQRGYHHIVTWSRSGETQASDILGLFIFELRQVRINLVMNLNRNDARFQKGNDASTMLGSPQSGIPAFGDLLHEGYLSVTEVRDILSQRWYPCTRVKVLSEMDSSLIGYCSKNLRNIGWILLDSPKAFGPLSPTVSTNELHTIINVLHSKGVRSVLSEIPADRNIRETFEEMGFKVNHTLYRLEFNLAYREK